MYKSGKMKLTVKKGRHYSTPLGVGTKLLRKFNRVVYHVTDWQLAYPYENGDSLDQNKLFGVNFRAFRPSTYDSVMVSSSHDSRTGETKFFIYANNSELRTKNNPLGKQFWGPVFTLENDRIGGVSHKIEKFEVQINRSSSRFVEVSFTFYDTAGNRHQHSQVVRISRKASKSRWFRTIQLWFGGNNVAPVDYSITYNRSII